MYVLCFFLTVGFSLRPTVLGLVLAHPAEPKSLERGERDIIPAKGTLGND